jgi:HAE1 family hydrophobic/amphiphilic exporter-1
MWMLGIVMRWRYATAFVALAIMASSVPLYRMIPRDYLPGNVDEAEFDINVSAPEGTSLPAMAAVSNEVERIVIEHPAVRSVLTTVGGGFIGGVNRVEMFVRIAPHEERLFSLSRLWKSLLAGAALAAWHGNYTQADVMNQLRRQLRYPDLRVSVRSQQAFNIPGGPFDIDFAICGPDLGQLAAYADRLRNRAKGIGIPDADTTLKLTTPELRVTIDRERAADLGVNARDIGVALRLLVGGDAEVSRFRDPDTNEDYDVELRLSAGDRNDPSTLPRLLVPGADGRTVELRTLASIAPAMSAARIDRLDRQRCANVRGSIGDGFALQDRIDAMRDAVAELGMPPAYTVRVLGRGRELERTFNEFLIAFALSVLFMYMILASNYESLVHPFTILLSIPLSVPFAFVSLLATRGTLNLYSALGILVLFGVVKKNAILQIDHMNQLRRAGVERHDAVLQGCRDRLRPILMTTLALVGGMLPLALGTGPGAEERRAIANVVIGGQTLCLLLTLLVTPVAYSLLDDLTVLVRRNKPRPVAEEALPVASTTL